MLASWLGMMVCFSLFPFTYSLLVAHVVFHLFLLPQMIGTETSFVVVLWHQATGTH